MGNIENAFIQATQVLLKQALSDLKFDKTIQGRIVSCTDVDKAEYKVRYQDSVLTVYGTTTNITYSEGDSVFILIPSNDFSARKIITGSTAGTIAGDGGGGGEDEIFRHFYTGVPGATVLPESDWLSPDTREDHLGDLYFDTSFDGHMYYYAKNSSGVYIWIDMSMGTITHIRYRDSMNSTTLIGKNEGTGRYMGIYTDYLVEDEEINLNMYTWTEVESTYFNFIYAKNIFGDTSPTFSETMLGVDEDISIALMALNATQTPMVWSDNAPTITPGNAERLWMSKGLTAANETFIGPWSQPVQINADTQFTHIVYSDGDDPYIIGSGTKYRGELHSWDPEPSSEVNDYTWTLVEGNYVNYIYAKNTSPTEVPIIDVDSDWDTYPNNDYVYTETLSGWSDTLLILGLGQYLWVSKALTSAAGTRLQNWSTPTRLSGEKGEDGGGTPGTPGTHSVTYYLCAPPTPDLATPQNITLPPTSGGVTWTHTTPYFDNDPTHILWVTRATCDIDNNVIGSWDDPQPWLIKADYVKASIEMETPIIHGGKETPTDNTLGYFLGGYGTPTKQYFSIGDASTSMKWTETSGLSITGGSITGGSITGGTITGGTITGGTITGGTIQTSSSIHRLELSGSENALLGYIDGVIKSKIQNYSNGLGISSFHGSTRKSRMYILNGDSFTSGISYAGFEIFDTNGIQNGYMQLADPSSSWGSLTGIGITLYAGLSKKIAMYAGGGVYVGGNQVH